MRARQQTRASCRVRDAATRFGRKGGLSISAGPPQGRKRDIRGGKRISRRSGGRWRLGVDGSARSLSIVFAVGSELQPANQQGRQDVLGLIVRPNADPTASRGNVRVIMRRNIVLTPVTR